MTFNIDNPEGGCNNPPLGKYVWEKPSGEQGLILFSHNMIMPVRTLALVTIIYALAKMWFTSLP